MVLAYGFPKPLYWSRLEKRSWALRGRNPTRDSQAPVRQWRVRPLIASAVRGRFLTSHWTPDLCLRKSCGVAAFWWTSPTRVRFSRMNHVYVEQVFDRRSAAKALPHFRSRPWRCQSGCSGVHPVIVPFPAPTRLLQVIADFLTKKSEIAIS